MTTYTHPDHEAARHGPPRVRACAAAGALLLGVATFGAPGVANAQVLQRFALRAEVGPEVPIVVVLDFHANLSPRMVACSDVLVGYRTNPHVDIEDRLMEAAEHVHRLLDPEATGPAGH